MNIFLLEQFLISDIIGLFRPKDKGPSGTELAAQKEQSDKLAADEAREKKEKRARDTVVAANQGRRGRGTLFQQSGELGVPKAKLGA